MVVESAITQTRCRGDLRSPAQRNLAHAPDSGEFEVVGFCRRAVPWGRRTIAAALLRAQVPALRSVLLGDVVGVGVLDDPRSTPPIHTLHSGESAPHPM